MGATTNRILALRDHLLTEQVSVVVMEATGDYWKPFYYLLEDAGFEVMLVNRPSATCALPASPGTCLVRPEGRLIGWSLGTSRCG